MKFKNFTCNLQIHEYILALFLFFGLFGPLYMLHLNFYDYIEVLIYFFIIIFFVLGLEKVISKVKVLAESSLALKVSLTLLLVGILLFFGRYISIFLLMIYTLYQLLKPYMENNGLKSKLQLPNWVLTFRQDFTIIENHYINDFPAVIYAFMVARWCFIIALFIVFFILPTITYLEWPHHYFLIISFLWSLFSFMGLTLFILKFLVDCYIIWFMNVPMVFKYAQTIGRGITVLLCFTYVGPFLGAVTPWGLPILDVPGRVTVQNYTMGYNTKDPSYLNLIYTLRTYNPLFQPLSVCDENKTIVPHLLTEALLTNINNYGKEVLPTVVKEVGNAVTLEDSVVDSTKTPEAILSVLEQCLEKEPIINNESFYRCMAFAEESLNNPGVKKPPMK